LGFLPRPKVEGEENLLGIQTTTALLDIAPDRINATGKTMLFLEALMNLESIRTLLPGNLADNLILKPCVDDMVVRIKGTGHRLLTTVTRLGVGITENFADGVAPVAELARDFALGLPLIFDGDADTVVVGHC